MILYFIKSTFLFLVFFFIYKGVLEKKKSSKFKRFYLLVATLVSLIFPLFQVQFLMQQNIITETKQIIIEEINSQELIYEFVPEFTLPESNETSLFVIIYVLISGGLAFRFLWHIDKILKLKRKGKQVKTAFGSLVLNAAVKTPFSFYDCIYLNDLQYKKGMIEEEILYHEQAHIQQKHSLDILLMEFFKVFLWFQPFLYVFKRLMQENHEYLADEFSISKTQNIQEYQTLILNFYNQPSKELPLSSSFHFSNLKKRFIMMKNMKKARVWEPVFYSSAALIIYFGFVGIEAQAAEINTIETKVSELIETGVKDLNQTTDLDQVFAESQVVVLEFKKDENTTGTFKNPSDKEMYLYIINSDQSSVLVGKLKAKNRTFVDIEKLGIAYKLIEQKEISQLNEININQNNVDDVVVLHYTKGEQYADSFVNPLDRAVYFYVVKPDEEVSIYNRYGVLQETKNFKFKLEEKTNRNQMEESDFLVTKSDDLPVLKYIKGQQNSGYFIDPISDGTYYYIISTDKEVSIYNRYGVKQLTDNFTFKLEEKVVDNSEERIKEEYEKRKELEHEVRKRSGLGEIDKKAEPKGGTTAFYKAFQDEFGKQFHPEKETELILRFIVEKDGTLTGLDVSSRTKPQAISSGRMTFADDNTKETMTEVLRVMQKMPNWNPAELKGKPVRSNYVMNMSLFSNKIDLN